MINSKQHHGSINNGDYFYVNFLIVGAQKSGTTALAKFLAQHKEVCIAPGKEIHLFDAPDFDDRAKINEINKKYREAFSNYSGQKLMGEATPSYMFLPWATKRIYDYNPDMKLIFLLRDPVQRAVSHYSMSVYSRKEWLPLKLAIHAEPYRLWRSKNDQSFDSSLRWHSYLSRGFYTQQIRRLLRYFPLHQMLFIKTESLLTNHEQTLLQIYNFLKVNDKYFIPHQEIVNRTEKSISPSLKIVAKLKGRFLKEVSALEKLLGWKLDDWK